jgi:chromosome partitioning protein
MYLVMTIIIDIATRKGGVNKTTCTFNLGHSIALTNKKFRVLLIDNDPQGDLTIATLGSKENLKTHTSELYNEKTPEPVFIRDNLAVIGTNDQLTFIQDKGFEVIYNLGAALENYKKDFDYILIDSLTHEGYLFTAGLLASNYVLSPMIPEPFAARGLKKTFDIVDKVRKPRLNPDLKILGVLLSTVPGNPTTLNKAVIDEIKQTYSDLVFKTQISKGTVASESPAYLQPVIEYEPKHKIGQQYMALAKEILQRIKR